MAFPSARGGPGRSVGMRPRKRIALAAQGRRRDELVSWATRNADRLSIHDVFAPRELADELADRVGLPVEPLDGGDPELGPLVRLAGGALDIVVLFVDPDAPDHPGVTALLRACARWDVALACTRAAAEFVLTSPMILASYRRSLPVVSDDGDDAGWWDGAGTC
jgi:methylglyoxal synthase